MPMEGPGGCWGSTCFDSSILESYVITPSVMQPTSFSSSPRALTLLGPSFLFTVCFATPGLLALALAPGGSACTVGGREVPDP